MYRHPEFQHAELGFGGKQGYLVVWLCGVEWITPQFDFTLSQWYSLCLTWSHTKDRPDLYVNGNLAGEFYFVFQHLVVCLILVLLIILILLT